MDSSLPIDCKKDVELLVKEQVLSPNEPSVNTERIVRQARSEKHQKIVPDLQQTRSTRDLCRQYGKMGGASDTAHDSGAVECLDLSEAIKQLREKQEMLAALMEGKMSS